MNTINNITNTASKAIWGDQADSNQPSSNTTTSNTNIPSNTTSASTGAPNPTPLTTTDSYQSNDTSNTSNTNTNTAAPAAGEDREMHKSMIDDVERPGAPSNGRFETDPDAKEGSYDENAPKKDASQHTQNTGSTADTDSRPAGGVNTGGSAQPQTHAGIQQGQNQNPMSNANEPNTGFGGAGAQPSVGADVSNEDKTQRSQGGDRPLDDPKDQEASDNNNKGSNGGVPKPLSGGSAGGAMNPDPGHGTGEGTGEKWEKSTGVQAEGGDFDATRPGAGREADRLMEQAGITHGEAPRTDDKADKKAFPVDHSGFGGHGSHTKGHSSSTTGTTGHSGHTGHSSAHSDNATTDKPIVGSDTGKKSLVEKVKEKVSHH